METYKVLEKALALIEDERNWCGDGLGTAMAHDPDSVGTSCAGAALMRVAGYSTWREMKDSLASDALIALLPASVSLGKFNDTHSHAEVCELFRSAIRNEKAKVGIEIHIPDDLEVMAEAAKPKLTV